jgi:hypothetical protein
MRQTFVDAVAAYFTARPGVWLDGRALATVGGAYAWRSRISDCRRLGMTIENRIRTVYGPDGRRLFRVSEYLYVPLAKGVVASVNARQDLEDY